MSSDVTQFAIAYNEAWVARDVDAVAALHAADGVLHLHDVTEPAVGREAIRTACEEFLAEVPDLAFEPVRAHVGDDHLVVEYVMRGSREGRPIACDGIDVFTIVEGLAQRKDSYIDWIAYQRETGVDVAAIAADSAASRAG